MPLITHIARLRNFIPPCIQLKHKILTKSLHFIEPCTQIYHHKSSTWLCRWLFFLLSQCIQKSESKNSVNLLPNHAPKIWLFNQQNTKSQHESRVLNNSSSFINTIPLIFKMPCIQKMLFVSAHFHACIHLFCTTDYQSKLKSRAHDSATWNWNTPCTDFLRMLHEGLLLKRLTCKFCKVYCIFFESQDSQ